MADADRCSKWRALASCRLDGELDELRTARLERHLLGCAACRSWTREIVALTGMLHEPVAMCSDNLPDLRPQTLRRRLVRAATTATAASAAAAAAFAIALPGALSLFSSGRPAISAAPCTSCMKKQALTHDGLPSSWTAVAPVHVAHPLESGESPS